jgi:hypothetical protein
MGAWKGMETEWVWGSRWTSWSNNKRVLDQKLDIKPWRLHDLRRSAATLMADQLDILPRFARPDFGERRIFRLVATTAEDCLSFQSAHVVCGSQRLPNNRDFMSEAVYFRPPPLIKQGSD